MPAYKIPNRYILRFIPFFAVLTLCTMSGASVDHISKANNQFGMDLFRVVANEDSNKLISPFSAHVVLSMAYQGTGGKTLHNFAEVFHFPSVQETAEQYSPILTQLNKIESVTLNIANKIYVKQNFKLNPTFTEVLQSKYNSEAEEIEFNNAQQAAQQINQWVENKTNDKIHELIKPDMLGPATRLVLLNAVYFKGNWLNKFDAAETQKKPFYLLNGEEIQVDMMHKNSKYRYAENEELNCKLVELPYQGNELSMVIFLPNERNGINQLQEKLASVDIARVMQETRQYDVNLELPKFKIESTIPMKDALVQLGAGNMFSDEADFSNMASQPLKVSDVIQKTFIEVNEEGAEAAAATGMLIRKKRSIVTLHKSDFIVDRPFMFSIVVTDTSQALFFGKVTALEKKSARDEL